MDIRLLLLLLLLLLSLNILAPFRYRYTHTYTIMQFIISNKKPTLALALALGDRHSGENFGGLVIDFNVVIVVMWSGTAYGLLVVWCLCQH